MSYDNSSYYGDLIVDEYDDKCNFIGTNTSMGYLAYHLLGDGFDLMSELCSNFMNDFSILTADTRGLDKFWGVSYNLPRPTLPNSERLLTDEEYKIYLYLRNCRLLTREDLLINFGKCFSFDDYGIFFSEENLYLNASDHLNYESIETIGSNLHKNDEDSSLHFVTDYSNDEETETIGSGLSTNEELITVINIPYKEWDNEYLEFLEQFISIKGNIKIKEYYL